ncbi:hypothetical protein CsSME_00035556 [Camellia sinensis var. sinensis]
MTSRNADSSQGEGGNPQHPAGPPERGHSRGGNKIFKSGPLFLSSKGIGWTSWKKRWFILTRTSLVFFRSDPSAVPQKGSEVNLTLGGIDLNNSGSVVVKAEKKLLTVLFPDGRDGRAFTLKAETLEDLYEWKAALEEALAHSPSATLVMGQNGIFRNDQADAVDGSVEQSKEKQLVKSLVIGRPVLLALEDIDGTPSFLEKALRFVEEHGVKVEGILRQAADVDDVERRIREYEQGKNDFSPGEDAHVIADCVKYFIRELPSSPVPASCCNALLEACRTDRGRRLSAMREAICETFPEPNRRLLQRILMMMQTVASHKAVNRMSSSAVAACMAPLLLRPLLSGDCELEHDFDVGGDGSIQLLQAAAAANHAQAIVITLLEEYNNIFGEGAMSTELYSDSEESGSESEELTDDDETIEDDEYDEDGTDASDVDIDEDFEHASNETHSETGDTGDDEIYDDKGSNGPRLISKSNESDDDCKANQKSSSSSPQSSSTQHVNVHITENFPNRNNNSSAMQANVSSEVLGDNHAETSLVHKLMDKSPYKSPSSHIQNSTSISDGPESGGRRPTVWGRTPGKKLAMESVDLPFEDEAEIERLEVTKIDLLDRIAEEASGNENLQASLERRKNASHERRLALEQEVTRLQEQLQKERELRTVLEAGLKMPQGPLPLSATIDEKTKADLEEIARVEADVINLKQKADDLGVQLNQQREQNCGLAHGSCNQPLQTPNHQAKLKEKRKDFETTATSHIPERSTRNKDAQLDKVESDRDMKQDLPFLANKHLPQNQRLDPVCCYKSVGDTTASSCAEPVISKLAPTNSKKSGTWGEGANSTSSALSKLTNRLNFLKERRNQIANELQNMDKGRSSKPSAQSNERGRGSESRQSVQNLDNYQEVDGQSGYNSEKGLGLDSGQSLQKEGHHVENMEKHRKSDKGRSEGQSTPNLERGKSESFPNADKGRRTEGHPVATPRTYSR